jgi:polar amino acid transport system substrate-binding protein
LNHPLRTGCTAPAGGPAPHHASAAGREFRFGLRAPWLLFLVGSMLLSCGPASQVLAQQSPIETSPPNAALAERLASGQFRWGGDVEGGAPYQLRDPNDPGRVIGFEVELNDALADVLSQRAGRNVRAVFTQYDWVSLVPGLKKGDFDLITSGLEITPENEAEIHMSRPYYVYAQQLVVRTEEQGIDGLDDLATRSVGTLSGSAADRILQTTPIGRIAAFDDNVAPYKDLELGRLDAVLLDLPIAVYYASTNPRLKFVGPRIGQGHYGVGLRRDDRVLAAAVDDALGELMRDGRLAKILRKWQIWSEDQAGLARPPLREQELSGLGFAADGRPLPQVTDATEIVRLDIAAESAQKWTFRVYAPFLLQAASATVGLTFASMAGAIAIGLAVCLARLYGPPPVRVAALVYVEFFRGTPLLLLLFFLYFGLPAVFDVSRYFGDWTAVVTAIVGFALNYAAYEAEIYRSAILSVPHGQWEAARALGMSEPLAFRRIIFPQAFRTALAPMTNDFVALFKDTSLVSVIAVRELTKEYLILSRSSLKFVELGLMTAALYLCMSVPLGFLSRWLERRWGASN